MYDMERSCIKGDMYKENVAFSKSYIHGFRMVFVNVLINLTVFNCAMDVYFNRHTYMNPFYCIMDFQCVAFFKMAAK